MNLVASVWVFNLSNSRFTDTKHAESGAVGVPSVRNQLKNKGLSGLLLVGCIVNQHLVLVVHLLDKMS